MALSWGRGENVGSFWQLVLAFPCPFRHLGDVQSPIAHPEDSGILPAIVITQADNELSYQVVIPAKLTAGKGRIRKQHYTLVEAQAWAREQSRLLKRGTDFLALNDKSRAQAVSAFHQAHEARQCLTTLVTNALAAVKLLGTPDLLVEAALFYRARKANVVAMPVVDAIEQLLAEKAQDGLSFVHLKDLRLRLACFTNKFGMVDVGDLDAPAIDAWLRGLDVGKRSRINYRRVVVGFLKFCERRGWLARGVIDAKAITTPKVKSTGTIAIFSPEQLQTLLGHSCDKLRPYFILGGLCGLRTAETLRLDWRDVDFKRNTVTISAQNAKTASRRIVPLCDAARQWLLPLRRESGKVLNYHHVSKETDRLLAKINKTAKTQLDWSNNALRHSYISYRVSTVQDVAKVALEAGNSPAMIFKNYRELVTDEAAAAWFNVKPATPAENIVPLGKAG